MYGYDVSRLRFVPLCALKIQQLNLQADTAAAVFFLEVKNIAITKIFLSILYSMSSAAIQVGTLQENLLDHFRSFVPYALPGS